MIRNAVMPQTVAHPQVFVDSTGRRKRLLAIAGFLVAIFATLYIGIVGTSVVQAADSTLATKATVSAAATATATAKSTK